MGSPRFISRYVARDVFSPEREIKIYHRLILLFPVISKGPPAGPLLRPRVIFNGPADHTRAKIVLGKLLPSLGPFLPSIYVRRAIVLPETWFLGDPSLSSLIYPRSRAHGRFRSNARTTGESFLIRHASCARNKRDVDRARMVLADNIRGGEWRPLEATKQ